MSRSRASLMDVHNALSHLVFATKQAMDPLLVDVWTEWKSGTYLTLFVECRPQHAQAVIDKLQHGFLQGDYDYRFGMIGHICMEQIAKMSRFDWTVISAQPNLSHDMARYPREVAA